MNLEISYQEQQLLIELLKSRATELHPTIRRSRVSAVTDDLKHDLEDVERLLEKVRNVGSEGASETET